MAPELGNAIRALINEARAKTGASVNDSQLHERARTALETGDYATLGEIASQLEKADQFEKGLGPRLKGLFDYLAEEGLLFTNVQEPELQTPTTDTSALVKEPLVSETPMTDSIKKEKKDGRRNEKYVKSAAQMIYALVSRNENKQFVINDRDTLILLTLDKKYRTNSTDIEQAKGRYETAVSNFGLKFRTLATQTNSKSVSEMVALALGRTGRLKINDQDWISFYKYIDTHYGDMKPNDFIEKIVFRFYTKDERKEVETQEKNVEKEMKKREEKIASEIVPGKIKSHPYRELVACMKLTSPGVLDKIQKQVLGGRDLTEILKKHGWTAKDSIVQELKDSSEKIAASRKNAKLTEEELNDSKNFILEALLRMATSKRGWHMIDKEYKGFRLLFALISEFSNEKNIYEQAKIASTIWEKLFEGSKYAIDQHGFPVIALPGTN